MSALSIVPAARRLVHEHAPAGADVEELVWFAASVLHDIWVMPGLNGES